MSDEAKFERAPVWLRETDECVVVPLDSKELVSVERVREMLDGETSQWSRHRWFPEIPGLGPTHVVLPRVRFSQFLGLPIRRILRGRGRFRRVAWSARERAFGIVYERFFLRDVLVVGSFVREPRTATPVEVVVAWNRPRTELGIFLTKLFVTAFLALGVACVLTTMAFCVISNLYGDAFLQPIVALIMFTVLVACGTAYVHPRLGGSIDARAVVDALRVWVEGTDPPLSRGSTDLDAPPTESPAPTEEPQDSPS